MRTWDWVWRGCVKHNVSHASRVDGRFYRNHVELFLSHSQTAFA